MMRNLGPVTLFAALACVVSGGQAMSAQSQGGAAVEQADPSAAPSGTYVTDPKHRYITFTYLHQGYSRPYLRWRDWTGELDWNAEDPAKSKIEVVIDTASIDSGVDEFDGHLRSADFFNAQAHPEITFVSTKVEKTGANTGKVTGDLTIKGVTKPVILDVTFNKADQTRNGGHKLGFSGRTTIERSAFGVDRYVPFVGDEVDILIEAEFVAEE